MADVKAAARTLSVDLCVIGAGSGGLSVAAGAVQLGASTVLIERHKMGGDCLNSGCVPSKALLAAAKAARRWHADRAFGVFYEPPKIDFPAVGAHVHGVIAAIAPNDSVERFEGLGVKVVKGAGRFVGAKEIEVASPEGGGGPVRIHARRIVVATGSSPAVPPIPGLADVPYLTNETVFDISELPRHLIVIGGGPIGLEMAQAHRALGSEVSVLDVARILPKDDPELVEMLRARLAEDGVALREEVKIERIERGGVDGDAGGVAVILEGGERLVGSHLLVAAGRKPIVAGLDLEKAGIAYGPKGIQVDERLRTTNKDVYAIGDVSGGPQFTHVAGYHAGIVIRNALFRLPAKVDYKALPWVTFTEPELAQVGLTEAAARQQHGDALSILRWPFHENDRAQTERETHGLVKVVATKKGKVLGASIIGAHAGELIHTWGLMIQQGIPLKALAGMIAPYPTLGEVSKRAAGSYFTPQLFSGKTRALVRVLKLFG
jgi:pyruvate/2-oxoglutarate dehydrogenase complex dihydrolipoamide dehydrogenase (E3) component